MLVVAPLEKVAVRLLKLICRSAYQARRDQAKHLDTADSNRSQHPAARSLPAEDLCKRGNASCHSKNELLEFEFPTSHKAITRGWKFPDRNKTPPNKRDQKAASATETRDGEPTRFVP